MSAPHCELCALLAGPRELLWRDARLSVVLVDDAAYPGFCRVIWNEHVKEMSELDIVDRTAMMDAVWKVEQALREVMHPDKINLASLGNMTPHLHWHVIPRFADDTHFPNPVWAPAARSADALQIAARFALLPQLRDAIVRRMNTA